MGEGIIIKEHEDGSATMELDLTEEERDILVSEGVNYILIKSLFGFNTDDELVEFISQHKGMCKE